jgi:hypothetical protein
MLQITGVGWESSKLKYVSYVYVVFAYFLNIEVPCTHIRHVAGTEGNLNSRQNETRREETYQ